MQCVVVTLVSLLIVQIHGQDLTTASAFTDTSVPASPCLLPLVLGRCRARMPRYHYSAEQGRCELFMYRGCGGNENNFFNKEDCEGTCEKFGCLLPSRRGFCRGRWLRWYYNPNVGACTYFIFGGCDGNYNNFFTREECQNTCAGAETLPFEAQTPKVPQRLGVMDVEHNAFILTASATTDRDTTNQ